ncbi:HTH domain-containing protein [uncultured Roseibium sp.]|uniref:helix-turn-helix transcriptional regulator n=1 Tax=uncultured Roseibium sp. TaxID=1936171 RepID=UPI0026210CA7|nr:HTH domain-containing protein [uncultured Roseibium sp.]
MRAARLLQILLLLQNRGRQTSVQLADELEVAPRTILRDVDAMTEAGLPIIVFQGNQGGIELGFNYRTRLTGLAEDEAKALGLVLAAENPMIDALGLRQAAKQARAKLIESFPDRTRTHITGMTARFTLVPEIRADDPRIRALALAVQDCKTVRIRFTTKAEQTIYPIAMEMTSQTWKVKDELTGSWIEQIDWGRVNVSAKRFSME